jgi:adenylate cyclase
MTMKSTPERYKLVRSAMQRELLRSERRRVVVLVGLLGFLMVVLMMLRVSPTLIRAEIRPQTTSLFVPLVIVAGAYLGYEIVVLVWLSRLLRTDRPPPAAFRYVNTLIEVSLPTAVMAAGALVMGGLPTLAGAAPFLYFLFLCLVALNLDFWLCVFAGAVASVEFVVLSLILLRLDTVPPGTDSPVLAMLHSPHQYLLKGVFLLAGGLVAGFVARQIRRQLASALRTMEERDRAISIFGQHVSPQVADLLLQQPMDFAGQERHVCVMFLDIRDFSRIANEHSPTEVMDYLNTLFGFMIPVINEHRGIINKFLGDGFMAVFGAPVDDGEQCRHAVEAAQVMLRRVEDLNREQSIPPTRLGIGLHLGVALTGNVGGSERKEYTVIGDVVNLASRIEQATKQFKACLLVSEAVVQSLGGPAGKDLGLVELKGQAQPIRLFKLA